MYRRKICSVEGALHTDLCAVALYDLGGNMVRIPTWATELTAACGRCREAEEGKTTSRQEGIYAVAVCDDCFSGSQRLHRNQRQFWSLLLSKVTSNGQKPAVADCNYQSISHSVIVFSSLKILWWLINVIIISAVCSSTGIRYCLLSLYTRLAIRHFVNVSLKSTSTV